MKRLNITCTSCGAPLEFSEIEKILTCEYCGSMFENPYYDEEEEMEAENTEIEEFLREMSRECRVAGHSFSHGIPLAYGKHHDAARRFFGIPHDTRVYMVYDATYACNCQDGIAFTNDGIYYNENTHGSGLITWEELAEATFEPTKKGLYINHLFFPSTRVTADELHAVLIDLQTYLNDPDAFDSTENEEPWTGTQEELLANLCGQCMTDASDLAISCTPLTSGKLPERARKYFKIPAEDHIYLVYDSTIFGSCKKGFALTNNGVYISESRDLHLTWDEFKRANVTTNDGLRINNVFFATADNHSRNILFNLLKDLQLQM